MRACSCHQTAPRDMLDQSRLFVTCWINIGPASVVLCIFCLLRRASTVQQGPATEIHFRVSSCTLRVASPPMPALSSQPVALKFHLALSLSLSLSLSLFVSLLMSTSANGKEEPKANSQVEWWPSAHVPLHLQFFHHQACSRHAKWTILLASSEDKATA